jgi:hypothetical protein
LRLAFLKVAFSSKQAKDPCISFLGTDYFYKFPHIFDGELSASAFDEREANDILFYPETQTHKIVHIPCPKRA